MAKKKKEEKVEQSQTFVAADTIGINPGDYISVNLRRQPYFWIMRGDERYINLGPENWCAEIPQDITYDELMIINTGILAGSILKGKVKISGDERNITEPKRYIYALDVATSQTPDQKFKNLLKALVYKKEVGGFHPASVIKNMVKHEESTKRRKAYIDLLNEAFTASTRVAAYYEVEDIPNDKEVVIDQNEIDKLVAESKKEVELTTGLRVTYRKPTNQELIDSILG